VYIDGVLEASNTVVGGSPSDPTGPFRLCGRQKPASWEDDNAAEDEVVWDAERFFLGRVAHFAVWDHTLSEEQVKALKAAYDQYYTLSMPHSDATSTLARGSSNVGLMTGIAAAAVVVVTLVVLFLYCKPKAKESIVSSRANPVGRQEIYVHDEGIEEFPIV
jgi:hypothetical protein